MNTYASKTQDHKVKTAANTISQKGNSSMPTSLFIDNRPEAVMQRKTQSIVSNYIPKHTLPIQKVENKTGMPDNLKSGIENLSGYSMNDVKVHYNSSKPAQLNAHAFAQGNNIHIASGQEKHLPHEAWHVVQQKQGRVKPILQMKGGVNVNDDKGLEKEADIFGGKALQLNSIINTTEYKTKEPQHFDSITIQKADSDGKKKGEDYCNNISKILDEFFEILPGFADGAITTQLAIINKERSSCTVESDKVTGEDKNQVSYGVFCDNLRSVFKEVGFLKNVVKDPYTSDHSGFYVYDIKVRLIKLFQNIYEESTDPRVRKTITDSGSRSQKASLATIDTALEALSKALIKRLNEYFTDFKNHIETTAHHGGAAVGASGGSEG